MGRLAVWRGLRCMVQSSPVQCAVYVLGVRRDAQVSGAWQWQTRLSDRADGVR